VTPLPDATRLAVERTRLAYERTLMAWVRTSTSLISFGFTIYKFFQYMREEAGAAHPQGLFGSREFALLMIVIGVVALVLSTVQHVASVRRLRTQYGAQPYSVAAVLATIVGAFGLLLLFVVIFRQ
jgi:putative membrane protein